MQFFNGLVINADVGKFNDGLELRFSDIGSWTRAPLLQILVISFVIEAHGFADAASFGWRPFLMCQIELRIIDIRPPWRRFSRDSRSMLPQNVFQRCPLSIGGLNFKRTKVPYSLCKGVGNDLFVR